MAFDGITVAALVKELRQAMKGARITKIAQPEADELLITFKAAEGGGRLFLSADPSLPLAYLTEATKPSPMTAPGFCMLLRKHIGSGRIISVSQPSMERIIRIDIEHNDEMGDRRTKALIIELMGKHSNIIFCSVEEGEYETDLSDGTLIPWPGEGRLVIVDSIKHVSSFVSSVRQVLPGREYLIPNTMGKTDPLNESLGADLFIQEVLGRPLKGAKAVYTSLTGFSPLMACELLYRAGVDADLPTAALEEIDRENIYKNFRYMMEDIRNENFSPQIVYDKGDKKVPLEFSALELTMYRDHPHEDHESISRLLAAFYEQKNRVVRIRQRSADLRKVASGAMERCVRKYDLQKKQLDDTEKMEVYRVRGELLSAYAHQVEPGSRECSLPDFYTGEMVRVPLDETISPRENSQKYFEKYGKLKRTKAALDTQILETREQMEHLDSILTSLDLAQGEDDLIQIRTEMEDAGYLKKKASRSRQRSVSRPLHYVSTDGYDIFVGKNNLQNEQITFRLATGGDWWFHAKKIPGSLWW